MRIIFACSVLGVLTLAVLLAPAGPSATADEGVTTEVWTYDVRMVRVDPTSPGVVEKPAPWEIDEEGREVVAPTLDWPWPRVLAALKERGKVTILMDQRVSGVRSHPVSVMENRDSQVRAFQRADINNENWIGMMLSTGSKATLVVGDEFSYEAEIRWQRSPGNEAIGGHPTGLVKWKGSYAVTDRTTIVLRHRDQLSSPGEDAKGLEFYAFLSPRRNWVR